VRLTHSARSFLAILLIAPAAPPKPAGLGLPAIPALPPQTRRGFADLGPHGRDRRLGGSTREGDTAWQANQDEPYAPAGARHSQQFPVYV